MDKYLKLENNDLRRFIRDEIYGKSEYSEFKLEYRLLDAIHWTLFDYGLLDEVYKWKDLETDGDYPEWIHCPNDQYGLDTWCDGPLCIVWSFLVHLFGNYGTSSRFGWIEDVESFRKFIELVAFPDGQDWAFEDLDEEDELQERNNNNEETN